MDISPVPVGFDLEAQNIKRHGTRFVPSYLTWLERVLINKSVFS